MSATRQLRRDRPAQSRSGSAAVAIRLLAACIVLSGLAALPVRAADRIAARVDAEAIGCQALGARGVEACAAALLREMHARAAQRFIAVHGLHATRDEIAALRAYEEAYARHDSEQRARKLEELETRLVHMQSDMSAGEREWLLEFHAVLGRLAAHEADIERGAQAGPELPLATAAHWIEQAKLDAALYRLYGGAVGLKPAGAYAHGGRAAMVAEHMLHAAVDLPDPEIERHFVAALWAPPAIPYRGSVPDFTAFWLRPLVPSYVGP